MTFRLGLDGLDVTSATVSAQDKRVFPKNSDLTIKITNLPISEFMRMGKDQLAVANGTAAPTTQKTPQAILSDAGTAAEYTLVYASDLLKVNGKGTVSASAKSMFGVLTDQMIEIEGLDAAIETIKAESANDPEAARMLQTLTMAQMMGQQDPNNPKRRTYHIVVDETGKATLNGSDLGAMMGGGAPAPAGAAPAPSAAPAVPQ